MSELVISHCPLRSDDVPQGWALTSISDFVDDIQTGFASGKHNSDGIGIPHLRPMNISPLGEVDLSDGRFVDAGKNALRLIRGDVLFNNTNSPAWVGKTALIETNEELAFSNHMTRLRVAAGIDSAFVAKQLHFLCRSSYFLHQCKKHVNQASINRKFLAESTPFLLPPSDEQRRIVAKVESLQERSARAREALADVGPLLEQFRQSVLRAAFSGQLTADWRAANPDVEPASELLTRIRTERRRRWEESELAKYEAKGKKPPQNWQDKYKEPEPVDDTELPELPDGWCWTRFGNIASFINGDRGKNYPNKSEYVLSGLPFINTGHIDPDGSLSLQRMNHITREKFDSLGSGKIQVGDLVYCLRGATLGKTAFVEPFTEGAIASSLVIIRPDDQCLRDYLYQFLVSPLGREEIYKYDNGSAQPNLSANSVTKYLLPVPPAAEMKVICELLRASGLQARETSAGVAELESALTQLDQSILAKAFRGELVPQNPNDEPATTLLERIRQKRETEAAQKTKPKKKRKTKEREN